MSTGRRLAKRSIIGTKVCAPGPDGLWYSGVIQDVKTPPNSQGTVVATVADTAAAAGQSSCDSSVAKLSADTRYIVRFDFKTQSMQQQQQLLLQGMDASIAGTSKSVIMEARRAAHMHTTPAQTLRRNAMMKEFRESDLVGPGFRSLVGIELQPGQRVFLTYNGRETSGDVVSHDATKDEVVVKITAIGTEEPIELKKRLEELRLLESRRSARLADQDRDTDFARLADMGGDRRRTSHSIEVPLTSSSSSSSAPASTMSHTPPQQNSRKRPQSNSTHDCNGDEETMNECNAALILMKLSHSPKSPKNAEKWLGSSPGSSSASWSSGSSSPPLSDDGHALHTSMALSEASASARMRTTSVSTSDEGIVVDFKEEAPRKKRTPFPKTEAEWEAVAKQFNEKWNFPNCIGAVDGKHVVMNAPANAGSLYYNYKGTHSIVLMGVADADYKLLYVDVGRNGRFSDGGVFSRCTFSQALNRNQLHLPAPKALPLREMPIPYVLVADDAFAMQSNVMKPYASRGLSLPQRVFNYRLSRARRIIENVFGIMSARFRVLRNPILLDADKAKRVVMACAVLHNFLMTTNKPKYAPASAFDQYDAEGNILRQADWRTEPPTASMHPLQPIGGPIDDAKKIQEEFMYYFTGEGELAWQYARV